MKPVLGKTRFEKRNAPLVPPPAPESNETMFPTLKFKKELETAKAPSKINEEAAGYDLFAATCKFDTQEVCWIYDTGIAFEIPCGFVGLVTPKSGITKKADLMLANSVGVIDSDYRGTVKFKYKTIFPNRTQYKVGDAIGQILIVPLPKLKLEEVADLSSTDRGSKGFGDLDAEKHGEK